MKNAESMNGLPPAYASTEEKLDVALEWQRQAFQIGEPDIRAQALERAYCYISDTVARLAKERNE